MTATAPKGLDDKVATFIIGVDTLFGGDALHRSGTAHVIADTYFSGAPAPMIYYDDFARAARDFAQDKPEAKNVLGDSDAVTTFVDRYGLRELRSEIYRDSTTLYVDDRNNLLHLADALDVMLRTVLSKTGEEAPSFEEKYRAATAGTVGSVKVADPAEARAYLEKTLSDVGYETSHNRNLRDTFLAWKADQVIIDPSHVAEKAREVNTYLLRAMRKNVFGNMNFDINGHSHDLSDVLFDGHKFETLSGVPFTGSSIYQGGEKEERPALAGLLEYNIDHPLTEIELYHLLGHEMAGHYLNAATRDLLWRCGRLGFTSTMGTMCTPDTVFQEGWAQNMFEILYGDRKIASDRLGVDLLVALAHADLEDFGKHNGAILHQMDGKPIEEVRRHIAEDCVQTDAIVDKLSRWAKNPIIGPMYGPAYLIGRQAVNEAITLHGSIPVAEIGYALRGAVDIGTFNDKMDRV